MRKLISIALALAGAFFCAPQARAQFTTVTATVTDPNNIPYAGAVMNAILVPGASGGYTLGGQPYSGRVGPVTLDSSGKFTAQFGDVTLITPGSPQWQITIDSAAATILPSLGTGPQAFTYTSSGTTISGSSPVSLTTALNALAPKLTNFAGAGTGTIAGTVTASHIPYASAANTLADIVGSAVTGATGAIALTAGADTTSSLAINSHSATQSATELNVNNQSSVSGDTPVTIRGLGFGAFTPGNGVAQLHIAGEAANTSGFGWVMTNHTADVAKTVANISLIEAKMHDDGTSELCGGGTVADGNNQYGCFTFGSNLTGGSGNETIIARSTGGGFTNIVPFAVGGVASQSVDIFDIVNSSNNVLTGFDKTGNLYFNGATSGLAKIGVAAVAGTPCQILLPTTSPSANQFLQSAAPSGGTCQTTWASGAGGVSSFSGDGTIITNSASTGAVTATIAGTSGGIPFFNSTSSWASSGLLAANVLIKGGGAGAAPTGSSLTDNATAVVGTEPIRLGNGTVSAPSYSFSGSTGDGLWVRSAGIITFSASTSDIIEMFNGGLRQGSNSVLGWTNASGNANGSADTGVTRVSAGVVGIGTGGAASVAGSIQSGAYLTGTNCSSSASPAVCGSAAAGSVVIAAAATTVTVNTTAVTANSQIDVGTDDTLGTKLSVTCNSTLATLIGGLAITARTAGTSFQITSGATPAVNPLCISYHITN